MRHRHVSHNKSEPTLLFGDDEENILVNKRKKQPNKCFRLLRVMAILFCICCLVYILSPRFSSILWIEYDNDYGRNIVKIQVPLDMYQTLDVIDRTYANWEEYARTWHKCLDIVNIGHDSDPIVYLSSNPVMYNGKVMIKHLFGLSHLLEAQKIYLMKTQKFSDQKGNFTIPTMYMQQTLELVSNKSVFPCICSMILDGNPNSFDKEIREKSNSKIIHMFNPKYAEHTSLHPEDRSTYAQAKITMPLLATFQEPFRMDIPHHLNVTFTAAKHESGIWKLEEKSLMFYDSINIINALNCISLNNMQINNFWKLKNM